jgi:hypothetical protein
MTQPSEHRDRPVGKKFHVIKHHKEIFSLRCTRQHCLMSSSNTRNVSSGNQNPPMHEGDHICVYMVKSHIDVAT